MMFLSKRIILLLTLTNLSLGSVDELEVENFVNKSEEELLRDQEIWMYKRFDYQTNITDHNEKLKLDYKVRLQGKKIQILYVNNCICL